MRPSRHSRSIVAVDTPSACARAFLSSSGAADFDATGSFVRSASAVPSRAALRTSSSSAVSGSAVGMSVCPSKVLPGVAPYPGRLRSPIKAGLPAPHRANGFPFNVPKSDLRRSVTRPRGRVTQRDCPGRSRAQRLVAQSVASQDSRACTLCRPTRRTTGASYLLRIGPRDKSRTRGVLCLGSCGHGAWRRSGYGNVPLPRTGRGRRRRHIGKR
jgi:hypothetical protein